MRQAGGLSRPPERAASREHNAVWLGIEWVNEPVDETAVQSLAIDLQRHGIRTVYVYTTYMRADNAFGATYAHAQSFVRYLKAAYPQVGVQAWIGLPLWFPIPSVWAGTVELADPDTRARIVALAAQMVGDAGFDGVHLDPEPVASGNRHLIDLLKELRERLGDGPVLSISGRHIAPVPGRIPEWVAFPVAWSPSYYRQVAFYVDEIAIMVYDSSLPWAWAYRAWTGVQTIRVSLALVGTGTRLYIGVPTSEERTYTHRPEAETISSGIGGVLDAFTVCPWCEAAVTGLAIYPHWETDVQEWVIFREMWLAGEPSWQHTLRPKHRHFDTTHSQYKLGLLR